MTGVPPSTAKTNIKDRSRPWGDSTSIFDAGSLIDNINLRLAIREKRDRVREKGEGDGDYDLGNYLRLLQLCSLDCHDVGHSHPICARIPSFSLQIVYSCIVRC